MKLPLRIHAPSTLRMCSVGVRVMSCWRHNATTLSLSGPVTRVCVRACVRACGLLSGWGGTGAWMGGRMAAGVAGRVVTLGACWV